MTIYNNSTNAFIFNLRQLLSYGDTVSVRGNETKELLSQTLQIRHPLQRVYMLPFRNDNIFAKIAETFWMLAGRNDIEWLSLYLPRAKDFSDDGKCWRGGYGPRLRYWKSLKEGVVVDQIRYVVNLLKRDPLSRQAVISIWNPDIDTESGKDIPCNNWIHFLLRDGNSTFDTDKGIKYLHMNVAQRSCDAMWGYSGIDTFAWSVLHEAMAYWVGAEVGSFNHYITSLHIYSRHYDRAGKILSGYTARTVYDYGLKSPKFHTLLEDFDTKLEWFFDTEADMREGEDQTKYLTGVFKFDDLFTASLQMLQAYHLYQRSGGNPDATINTLNIMRESDFHLAAVEYLSRTDRSFINRVRLTGNERSALYDVMGWKVGEEI